MKTSHCNVVMAWRARQKPRLPGLRLPFHPDVLTWVYFLQLFVIVVQLM